LIYSQGFYFETKAGGEQTNKKTNKTTNRNRTQINTQKTIVMAFFETPSLQKARGGQHQPRAGPTLPPPFPTSVPRSYFITEVLEFEYFGLILDPKLTMHLAATKAMRRRVVHGLSVTQAQRSPILSDIMKNVPSSPQHKTGDSGNLLYQPISFRICATSRVLLMLRNFRLAFTSFVRALFMSIAILQSYSRTLRLVPPPLL